MPEEPLILAQDVHRTYLLGKKVVEVLQGIDLEIMQGERVFLCGASGAGKTTLLYTLAGLERPQRVTRSPVSAATDPKSKTSQSTIQAAWIAPVGSDRATNGIGLIRIL